MEKNRLQTIRGKCPSKSNCYRVVTIDGHGSLAKQKALTDYERSFYLQCDRYRGADIRGLFALKIRVYYDSQRPDLDNCLKVVLDCLQQCRAIREMILRQFKAGEIPVVANVGVLVCGFDYPELDTIVIARPTMSLALYYQIVGRAIRPHPNKKEGWIVDLAGNIKRFGKVEDLRLVNDGNNKWSVWNKNKQLTNVRF